MFLLPFPVILRSSGRESPFFARTKLGGCPVSLSGTRPQSEHPRKQHPCTATIPKSRPPPTFWSPAHCLSCRCTSGRLNGPPAPGGHFAPAAIPPAGRSPCACACAAAARTASGSRLHPPTRTLALLPSLGHHERMATISTERHLTQAAEKTVEDLLTGHTFRDSTGVAPRPPHATTRTSTSGPRPIHDRR